jgi:hypothetical protein
MKLSFLFGAFLAFSAVACASGGGEDVDGSGEAETVGDAKTKDTIVGTLSGPGGANAHLTLTCKGATVEANADVRGSYRLTIAGSGRCYLQVNDMPAPGQLVFLYDEATIYDYEVSKVDGVTQISRR